MRKIRLGSVTTVFVLAGMTSILSGSDFKSQEVAENLRASIRRGIMIGQYLPGDRILENDVAQTFKASVATVRQAFAKLEHEQVVSRSLAKGARIANFSRDDVKERNAVRVGLEVLAFQKAPEHLRKSDYSRLKELIAAMTKDPDADHEFHRLIWRRSGNRTLELALEWLVGPLFIFVNLTRAVSGNLADRMKAHHRLLKILQSVPQPASLEVEITDHVNSAWECFVNSEHSSLREMAITLSKSRTQRVDDRGSRMEPNRKDIK